MALFCSSADDEKLVSVNVGQIKQQLEIIPRDSVDAAAVPLGDSGKASNMVPSRWEPTLLGMNLWTFCQPA